MLKLAQKQKNLDRVRAGRKAAATRKRNQAAKRIVGFRKDRKTGKTHPITGRTHGKTKIIARQGATLKVRPKNQVVKAVTLKDYGYKYSAGELSRHNALDKAVKKEGYGHVIRLLQVQSFADKNLARTFKDDMAYVRGKYSPAPKPYQPKKPKSLGVKHWVFDSGSNPGTKYYVVLTEKGNLRCNCPGYIYPHGDSGERTCIHVREVQEKLKKPAATKA